MLSWLLRILVTVAAARLVARALRGGREAPARGFDPAPGPKREKVRAARPFGAGEVADAEYEELPKR